MGDLVRLHVKPWPLYDRLAGLRALGVLPPGGLDPGWELSPMLAGISAVHVAQFLEEVLASLETFPEARADVIAQLRVFFAAPPPTGAPSLPTFRRP